MLLRSAHATACCTVQPSCFQHCIKLSSCIKNTYIFKITSIIVTCRKNMCPSISEGIYYAMYVAQGDVHLGYRCYDATGIVHHSSLQTLDGVNTPVPHLTPKALEPPFAAGKENNCGEAGLPDGCSYTLVGIWVSHPANAALHMGLGRFLQTGLHHK